MEKDNDFFFDLLESANLTEIQEFINEKGSLDFWNLTDEKGNNVLHKTLSYKAIDLLEFFLKTTKIKLNKEEFEKFINHQNNSGLTPILYSAYLGSFQMSKLLLEYKADPNITNKKGLGVMHMAAQGNRANILFYFKTKLNFSIDQRDKMGSTPLHWAAYSGSEQCVDFLFTWNVDVNALDNEGLTPLHLAVVGENVKIVKKLIRKGADKNIKDKKGRTPRDIAQDQNSTDIFKALSDSKRILKCCIIKPPVEKMVKSIVNVLFFFIVVPLIVSGQVIFVFPFIKLHDAFLYVYIFYPFLLITNYIILLLYSSSSVNSERQENFFLPLVLSGDSLGNYCPKCAIKKHIDMKHCFICDECCPGFDHHCYWINRCVGDKNYPFFFCFIILCLLELVYNIFIDSNFLHGNKELNKDFRFIDFANTINKKNKNILKIGKYITSIAILSFSCLFGALVLLLLINQIRVMIYNCGVERRRREIALRESSTQVKLLGESNRSSVSNNVSTDAKNV